MAEACGSLGEAPELVGSVPALEILQFYLSSLQQLLLFWG